MDEESTRFRHALLKRLIMIASLPAVAVAAGCGTPDERCFDWTQDDACPAPDDAQYMLPRECTEVIESVDTEGVREGDACCYEVTADDRGECAVEGRPLRIGDISLAARPREDGGWLEPTTAPSLDGLDRRKRSALATMWTDAALAEHASIASFAKNTLELMAFGAPRRLVEEAQRAGLDEVRHASMSFALATTYAGKNVGPSALPLPEAVPIARTLKELAVATAVEACLNETLAVIVAGEQRARATDPAVRHALGLIIDDETRHAAIAWLTVRWAIQEGGEDVRRAVERALLASEPNFDAGGSAEGDPMLEAHGLLDAASRRDAAIRGYREVIRPAMTALLDVTQGAALGAAC